MNRAERRKFNKLHKTSYSKKDFDMAILLDKMKRNQGLSDEDIETLMTMNVAHYDNEELVPDGTQVKLNYEAIKSRPQKDLSDAYKAWLEENKDKEFHISRENVESSLVALAEDLREVEIDGVKKKAPQWLFDLYSDLYIMYNDEYHTMQEILDAEYPVEVSDEDAEKIRNAANEAGLDVPSEEKN